jgi:hypothetical protein
VLRELRVRYPAAVHGAAVSVTTAIPDVHQRRKHSWIHDNWPPVADRGRILSDVAAEFGLQSTLTEFPKAQIPHARELRFTWAGGQTWLIRLDEGFGFMRVAGADVPFRFDQTEPDQATALRQAGFSVEGRITTTLYVFGMTAVGAAST